MCPWTRAPPAKTARWEATATSSGPAHNYDNMKSVVLECRGDAIRFHPTLLELAAHYRFEPRPVAPARGNEKGRVERLIRFARQSFFSARRFRDLDDLNDQADEWCRTRAAERPFHGLHDRKLRATRWLHQD